MNKYTIWCTKEQAKRALALGAPLVEYSEEADNYGIPELFVPVCQTEETAVVDKVEIPTAEQLKGWMLEENGLLFLIEPDEYEPGVLHMVIHDMHIVGFDIYGEVFGANDIKQATLDAIDGALGYLEQKEGHAKANS